MAKIFIIEDDNFLNSAYEIKFKALGHTVHIETTGEQVEAKIKEAHPDIIVLDLILPKINGIDILKGIKKNPDISKIPVVISTNIGFADDMGECMTLGAVDYFIKSDIPLDKLVSKIIEDITPPEN